MGGVETYAGELSAQLGQLGWKSVLVFLCPPSGGAETLFDLPNTRVEVVEGCGQCARRPLRAMARLLAKYRPGVVHLHFMDAWSGLPWLARLYGAERVFITHHDSRAAGYVPPPVARWKRPLLRLVYLPVTKILCVSSYVRRCVQAELEFLRDRVETAYLGVDTRRARGGIARREEFRRRYAIPPDRIVVLQVSWLIPEKGVGDLLQAARQVLDRKQNVHFVFAGDGPRRPEYERVAEQLGISANVSFLGEVKDPLGEGLYASCDIVCQVSRWEEAFGLTIAEAMASQKPVIATRVGGIPEIVEDGKSGFLIERGDTRALAEKILLLADAPGLRESMGQAGRGICREKFDLRKNVAMLIYNLGAR
jgi:glycosyltransferase involved in cell wall biosynthesis